MRYSSATVLGPERQDYGVAYTIQVPTVAITSAIYSNTTVLGMRGVRASFLTVDSPLSGFQCQGYSSTFVLGRSPRENDWHGVDGTSIGIEQAAGESECLLSDFLPGRNKSSTAGVGVMGIRSRGDVKLEGGKTVSWLSKETEGGCHRSGGTRTAGQTVWASGSDKIQMDCQSDPSIAHGVVKELYHLLDRVLVDAGGNLL
jgi:hypothetical protein